MKILLINGHPGGQSLSLDFAQAYLSGAKKTGADVQAIHVKDLKFDPILHDGYKKPQALEPDLVRAQELIKWADHLVVFSPVWWNSVPALLKGFFDRILLPGFAFKFTGKGKWDKYLKGKTARLVLTTGGPALFHKIIMSSPVQRILGFGMLGFCGFKLKCPIIVGSAGELKEKQKENWIKKINELGQKQK